MLFYAERISEEYPECDMEILIAAALLHDIGIKVSEEKHGYNTWQTQVEYGPQVAEDLLSSIGFPLSKI